MLSKAKLGTPSPSNKGMLKFLRWQVTYIESYFGKKYVKFRTAKGSDVWSIKQSTTIVFGKPFLTTRSRKNVLLALIHELGHLYTNSSKNKVTAEVNANLWAIHCIETLYNDDVKLKKLYKEYLKMCLNAGPSEHSEGVFELMTTIGGQVLKTTKDTLILILPHKYKDW